MSKVFVSYSSKDRSRCAEIVESLEKEGINCWVAPRDIPPGALWMESVMEAIDDSSSVLLLVTAYSNSSSQVRRELERAVSKSKMIVPLVLEEVQFSKWMQYSISIHHWQSSQCADLSRDLQGVVASLHRMSTGEMGPDTVPQEHVPVTESLLELFSMQRPISLMCSYRFSDGEVPEELLLSAQSEVDLLAESITGKYGLSHRYTEKKIEYAYSLDSDSSSEDSRARVLSAAVELFQGLNSIRNRPHFSMHQFTYSIAVFPDKTDEQTFTNEIEIDQVTEKWLQGKEIPFPGIPSETVACLQNFINRTETVLPECSLVGRAAEVTAIMSLVEKQQYWHIENPRGFATHLIAGVCGRAGVGKTALLKHIEKDLSKTHQVLVVKGSASTGNLWLSVLADLLGVENPEGVTGDVLSSALRESYGAELCELDSESLARFCSSRSLASDAEQSGSSVSVQVAFRSLFTALSEEMDIVFFLEDIHDADSFSLEVFRFIVANTERNRPFVFVLSFRPGVSGENIFLNIPEGYFIHESFDLEGLNRDSQKEFCTQLLSSAKPGSRCSPDLLEFISDRTEGNPLYIRELLESLLQKEVISLRSGEWELSGDLKGIEFPQNLKQMYDSRLQNLDERGKVLLKCLSVLGERFPLRLMYSYLEKIAFGTAIMDSRIIDSLAGFLRTETSAFRRSVVFSHALLREHLYSQLNDEQRRTLHNAAARTLEGYSTSDPGEISIHFSLAGEVASALRWGEKKLDHLIGIHDNRGILSWSDRLLSWIPGTGKFMDSEYRVRKIRCRSLSVLGKKELQEDELTMLGDLAPAFNDSSIELEVMLMRASFFAQTGQMSEASVLLSEIEKSIYDTGESSLLFKFYDTAGRYYLLDYKNEKSMMYNEKALNLAEHKRDEISIKLRMASIIDGGGDHEPARKLLEEALNSARSIHAPVLEVSVMNGIAKSLFDTGDWEKAEEFWRRAIQLARKTGIRKSEASMLNLLGHLLSKKNSMEEALQIQLEALKVMEESGNKHGICKVLTDLGLMYIRTGQKEKALLNLERSLDHAREMNNPGGIAAALANISSLQKDLGEYDAAEENIREAIKFWQETGYKKREASCIANLGSILEKKGKMDESIDCFSKALRIGEECGDKEGNSTRYGNLAVMMQIKRNWEESEELYNKAIAVTRELGNTRMHGMWTGYKAALLDTTGRREEAAGLYKESMKALVNVGDEPYLIRVMTNYADLLAKMDEDEESLALIKKELEICKRLGYKVDEASALCSLAHYHLKAGDCAEAFSCFRDSCLIAAEKKMAVHLFRGIMPLYRELKEKGFEQVDEYFPRHWGNPEQITRDDHMPEKKRKNP